MAIDDLPWDQLRARTSVKWRQYPPDVLPAWVAEMDFTLADPIKEALIAAIERSDTGYRWTDQVPGALSSFAAEEWSWSIDPERVTVLADVMSAIALSLEYLTDSECHVVINPPVYPPFFSTVGKVAGRVIREVPLALVEGQYRLDLDALGDAFADPHVQAFVLCSPHNPTGTVHSAEELRTVAELADRHGVLVIADEVHAPMTLVGATHTPYLSVVSDDAAAVSIVSASKTWNIPGMKCAQLVGTAATAPQFVEKLAIEATFGVGHFGVLSTVAAYRDGGAWRSQMLDVLDNRRRQLADGLAAFTADGVQMTWPDASYLAWVRFANLGEDPAAVLLDEGKLAVNSGPAFGEQGVGHARINYATSEAMLNEIISRVGAVVRSHAS